THTDAASWYGREFSIVPRNCLVPGNGPVPLDETAGVISKQLRGTAAAPPVILRCWDLGYARRAQQHPVVLGCKRLFSELHDPPVITREDWEQWCGGVPATRTPPVVSEGLWKALCERAGITE